MTLDRFICHPDTSEPASRFLHESQEILLLGASLPAGLQGVSSPEPVCSDSQTGPERPPGEQAGPIFRVVALGGSGQKHAVLLVLLRPVLH